MKMQKQIKDKYLFIVKKFMDNFIEYSIDELYPDIPVDDFLIIMKEFSDIYYNTYERKGNKITHKILNHSFRVLEHFKTILIDLKNNGHMFNLNEINAMYIAISLHDIGKFITENDNVKNKDHAIISYLMVKYLLNKTKDIDLYYKNIILEMVGMHSNKKQNIDDVSIYTKIIRDADLFDERCGDSLFELLRNKATCVDNNLNEYEYDESEYILECAKSIKTKKYVYERINIQSNKDLFSRELERAESQYYEYFYRPRVKTFMEDLHNEIFKDQYLYINIEI